MYEFLKVWAFASILVSASAMVFLIIGLGAARLIKVICR